MIADHNSSYSFKDELIRNYINLIVHETLKMQPSETVASDKNAAQRITSMFLELLERQFPIENTERHQRNKSSVAARIGAVAEIAFALGFEYPTYFNNFFKKKTGQIPKAIRAMHL